MWKQWNSNQKKQVDTNERAKNVEAMEFKSKEASGGK